MSLHLHRLALALALTVVATLAACAGGEGAPAAPEPEERRGVPGFDTRDYPGDAVMARWLDASPYRWVGYYLPAPCYTGTSWQGKRAALRGMGWGVALLFVGEQDWPTPAPEVVAGTEPDRCTRGNLTAERGRADGVAAARAARAEGFPTATVVYLDVERVEAVSDSLRAYVEAWTEALVREGYAPGLYAHARNADPLLSAMGAATATAGRTVAGDAVEPRLWVASTDGFSLRRGPTESGFPATIWQGALDVEESWAGTRLRIDRNVADRPDPSTPADSSAPTDPSTPSG